MPQPVLHLSSVLRSPLLDRAGERLGRVEDLIVRLADGGYPPVTGLKARIGGRELFVPVDRIAALEPGAVRLSGEKLSLGRFERRAGEVLLAGDVLGRKLVAVEADPPRLITAHEIELACIDGWWRVVGVDASARARLRRALPRRLRGLVADRPFLDWADMEPFVGHVPSARLRISHRKLANLHPAEIADLVEAASHDEGEEIIEAVGQDRELEADVFEELDEHHQLEFIRERPDAQVAAVIARMDSDDAADLIAEIDQDRRGRILALLPPSHRRRIEALLGYNPSTAGGLDAPRVRQPRRGRQRGAGAREGGCERARAGHPHDRLPARRRGAPDGLGVRRRTAARPTPASRRTSWPTTSRSRCRPDRTCRRWRAR